MTPWERALLTLTLQQLGRVYSRAEIVQEVWDGRLTLVSNVIDMHTSSLRHKLYQHGGQGLLQNVRGVGYALKDAGPVTRPSGLNALPIGWWQHSGDGCVALTGSGYADPP